jgi:hypothetical protein
MTSHRQWRPSIARKTGNRALKKRWNECLAAGSFPQKTKAQPCVRLCSALYAQLPGRKAVRLSATKTGPLPAPRERLRCTRNTQTPKPLALPPETATAFSWPNLSRSASLLPQLPNARKKPLHWGDSPFSSRKNSTTMGKLRCSLWLAASQRRCPGLLV